MLAPPPEVRTSLRNRMLAALTADDLARLGSALTPVWLDRGDVLLEADARVGQVYFPESAVLSLERTLEEGGTVEVGTVGCEGMAGLAAFLGGGIAGTRALVQIAGDAYRMDARVFGAGGAHAGPAHAPPALDAQLLRYTQAFLAQVAQTAACNAAHRLDARCARWLLMTHDRVGNAALALTREFLAFMLGVRRPGVTVALRALQDRGVVDYARGRIIVLDRARLEDASCECYRVVRARYDRLLGVGA